jgi:serine/threonine protein kinase
MGVVWQAYDEQLERPAALKFLPEALAQDERAFEMLKKETQRCLDLTHPHIVRVHDLVREPQGAGAAIVMEYIAGRTWSALQAERPHRCFHASELRPWLGQLCEALTYAHEKGGVIHRDLKPGNVMITEKGDLKLMDFGISWRVAATQPGTLLEGVSGTPAYMSPQQLQGAPPTAADDIYSLGATIYELVTGAPPFAGSLPALMHQILTTEPMSPTAKRAAAGIAEPLPAPWETTILRCLSKEADHRPKSVRELWTKLSDIPNPDPPLEQTAARGRMLVTLMALLVISAAAWLFRTNNQPLEKERSSPALANTPAGALSTTSDEGSFPGQAGKIRVEISRAEYRIGEAIALSIDSAHDCFVWVLQLAADGSATQLLPNRFQPDHQIRAGEALRLPDPNRASQPYQLRTTPPAGDEEVVVFYATAPFDRLRGAADESRPNFPIWPRSALFQPDGRVGVTATDPTRGPVEVRQLKVRYRLTE